MHSTMGRALAWLAVLGVAGVASAQDSSRGFGYYYWNLQTYQGTFTEHVGDATAGTGTDMESKGEVLEWSNHLGGGQGVFVARIVKEDVRLDGSDDDVSYDGTRIYEVLGGFHKKMGTRGEWQVNVGQATVEQGRLYDRLRDRDKTYAVVETIWRTGLGKSGNWEVYQKYRYDELTQYSIQAGLNYHTAAGWSIGVLSNIQVQRYDYYSAEHDMAVYVDQGTDLRMNFRFHF